MKSRVSVRVSEGESESESESESECESEASRIASSGDTLRLRFRVWGLGCGVLGLEVGVSGSGLRGSR